MYTFHKSLQCTLSLSVICVRVCVFDTSSVTISARYHKVMAVNLEGSSASVLTSTLGVGWLVIQLATATRDLLAILLTKPNHAPCTRHYFYCVVLIPQLFLYCCTCICCCNTCLFSSAIMS
jgi:hypothetical protein